MTAPAAPSRPNVFDEFGEKYGPDSVLFVREVLGAEPDEWQEAVLRAYDRGDRRIAIRSGHGVGKTTTLAWIIVHQAVCRFPQKTVVTAPTTKQLWDALYAETVKWFKQLPDTLLQLFEIKAESIELVYAPEESFVSFRTSSAEKPEALAGVHCDPGYVLLICDEGSGIPEPIYEAAAGSMSQPNACMILAGNPVRTSGTFFDVWDKMRHLWTTFVVSCVDCKRVSRDFIEMMKAQYGENSNAYRVRVLGEFPKGESSVVIPFELLESAKDRDVKPQMVRPIWGLDVGLSGDPSALCKRKGNCLLEPTVEFFCDDDLMKVVAFVKEQWDKTLPSDRPSEINVDVIGLGAGVAHRLAELGLPARGVNVSETAALSQRFRRLRDELWWKAREWCEKRDCSFAGDAKLAEELGRPTYEPSENGKTVVESKKKTKKRTKTKSPNRADSFLLTLASEAIIAGVPDTQQVGWNQPLRRIIKGMA